jgi:dCTP deaminase
MILSNLEIQKALDDGRLIITPEPSPRKLEHGMKYCPYNTHSVDIKLSSKIAIPRRGSFSYDFAHSEDISQTLANNSDFTVLTKNQPFKLEPGVFVLGWTYEKIVLPIKNGPPYLAARIEGRSSRSRVGILVHFTAPTVHPGWSGHLTLEMMNLGPNPFLLSPEMPIAQLIFEQVDGQIMLNPSDFQDQSNPTGTK